MRTALGLLFILFASFPVQARVFDFNSNWFAPYLRTTGGYSDLGKDLYRDSSGSSTVFSDSAELNVGVEMGFSVLLSDQLAVRFAVEGLQSQSVTATGIKSGTSNPYLDVESQMNVFNPNLVFEANIKSTPTWRLFAYAGAGYATVKVGNDYTITALATTDYSVPADYKEGWEATTISYQGGIGYEFALIDNVTLNLDLGYRMIEVDEFEHNASATVIRGSGSTAVAKGQTVLDDNGRKVSLDMNGAFVGLAFKFYIPPIK